MTHLQRDFLWTWKRQILSEILQKRVGWIFGPNYCQMSKLMLNSINQNSHESYGSTGKHKNLYIQKNKSSVSYMKSLSFFLFQGIFIVLVYPAMSQPMFYILLLLEIGIFLPVNLYFPDFLIQNLFFQISSNFFWWFALGTPSLDVILVFFILLLIVLPLASKVISEFLYASKFSRIHFIVSYSQQ